MNARTPVELAKAYLLLNHGPVTLVSSAHLKRRNLMAASWAMPLDFNPPKVAVVIDRQMLTRDLRTIYYRAGSHFVSTGDGFAV